MLKEVIILIASYLLGSLLIGDVVANLRGFDLRGQGSGNIGATNVFRTMGPLWGAIVLIGDALKGVIAVLLGTLLDKQFGFDQAILTGFLAIIGHNWSIFAKFRGGKGIATTLGVTIALLPFSLGYVLAVWVIALVLFGFVSLASVIVSLSYPVIVFITYPGDYYRIAFGVIVAGFAVYKHRSNIQRLLHGEEKRILYVKKGAKNE